MNRALSPLAKTWIFDLDGTVVVHNGYKTGEGETLLPSAKEFFSKISKNDMIIFITSRNKDYKTATELFLQANDIPFHHIIYDAPYGERILINDCKPSGLPTAIAINTKRDAFMADTFTIDPSL